MHRSSRTRKAGQAILACAALAAAAGVRAQAAIQVAAASGGLAELSLEQLGELPVTSVSGRAESLRSAASSVFVISSEDIRRSAATSLPEALRLAPNLQVARLNAAQYAISARGFNNAIANKLLVLIDGRTIYSTLFSGVFWDFHDLVLEDIERIEVISGPGGTLWGANAVNGIINVITRSAAATQGPLVSVTRSQQGGQESVRWGGKLGEDTPLRIYALGVDRGASRRADGVERPDAASKVQAGFRADSALAAGRQVTVQGDIYRGGDDPANALAPKLHGGNLLARLESRFANGTPYRVQAYYDLQARDETTTFRNRAESLDVQFTHEPALPAGQQLLWGAGYRVGRDENEPSPTLLFDPAGRRLTWANVFAQHQVRWSAWQLTTGAKAERNSYTGLEFLPSVRLAYEHAHATTWGALSRTVRAPARIDRDFYVPGRAPFVILGGTDFESEVARVLEVGHRGQAGSDLTYSATVFRQNYKGLRGGIGSPPRIANRIEGNVDGVEAWAQWQPAATVRLTAGLLRLHKDLRFSAPPVDANGISNLGNDPRQQWSLRAQLDLPRRTEFGVQLRHVGALPSPAVPAYTVADARLGWQMSRAVELSVLAQSLFNERHAEFNAAPVASRFGRTISVRVVIQP